VALARGVGIHQDCDAPSVPSSILPSAREDVASLTQGVLKAMMVMKVKAAAMVLAVVGLAISGGQLTHRLLAVQRSPEASTADAAPRAKAPAGAGKGVEGKAGAVKPVKPIEFKVLDRLAGKWRYEWESKPTEAEPTGSKGTGTSTNEWILDGWFQQHNGKGDNPPHEILEVWTYDAHTKTYRAWGFMAPGANHYEATATWDEKTDTLTYTGKGPGDVTTVSTMRFIDKDNRVGTRAAKNAAGKLVQDTRFKLTRQK
jgi:Protein of unknown function (DUF1579)